MNTPLESYLAGVEAMARKAAREHGPLECGDHGHGLLLEELAEYFDEVRKKEELRDHERMACELIDIGAVALRCMILAGATSEAVLERAEHAIRRCPLPRRTQHTYYSMLFTCAVRMTGSQEGIDPSSVMAILGIAGAAYQACCAEMEARV